MGAGVQAPVVRIVQQVFLTVEPSLHPLEKTTELFSPLLITSFFVRSSDSPEHVAFPSV